MFKIVSALLLLSLAYAAVTPISDDNATATAFNWVGYWYASNNYAVYGNAECLPLDPISITQTTNSSNITGLVVSWTYPTGGQCQVEGLEGAYTSPLITSGGSISVPTSDGSYDFVSSSNSNSFTYVTGGGTTVNYESVSNTGFNWTGSWSAADASDAVGCIPNNPITITTSGSGLLVSWTFPGSSYCSTDSLAGSYTSPVLTPLSAICAPVGGTLPGCYTFISNPSNSNQFTYQNSEGIVTYNRAGSGASLLAHLSLVTLMIFALFAY
jgi:hypothetical protein